MADDVTRSPTPADELIAAVAMGPVASASPVPNQSPQSTSSIDLAVLQATQQWAQLTASHAVDGLLGKHLPTKSAPAKKHASGVGFADLALPGTELVNVVGILLSAPAALSTVDGGRPPGMPKMFEVDAQGKFLPPPQPEIQGPHSNRQRGFCPPNSTLAKMKRKGRS